jgi:two-component system, NarL family, response regulator LiaR
VGAHSETQDRMFTKSQTGKESTFDGTTRREHMMSAAYIAEYRPASVAPRPSYADPVPVSSGRTVSGRVTVRVLIASHQPIIRHGLRGLIDAEPDLDVIGEAGDGEEAVRLARRLQPDLVLIDVGSHALDGISTTRMICSELRGTQVIVMSGGNDDISAVESVRAGAVAYLRRDARIEDLLRAIRGAGAGQVVMPARTVARLVRSMGRHEALSQRETEVLCLVARGLANKQVARQMGIAESTVKCHVSGVLAKLGLPSRTQIALYAARIGLVALEHSGGDSAAESIDAWRTA